jgi:hypothetical protein
VIFVEDIPAAGDGPEERFFEKQIIGFANRAEAHNAFLKCTARYD